MAPNLLNGHKIYQKAKIALKYMYIVTFSIPRSFKMYPKLRFLVLK
jgi:hypothetical protein